MEKDLKRMTYNDERDKDGKLGVKWVKAILENNSSLKDERDRTGCSEHTLIDTEGTEENRKEIDVIEEWKDAAGKLHRKAHEVKLDNMTLDAMKKSNYQTMRQRYLWQPYTTIGTRPTGNIPVEFVQKMPKEKSDKLSDKLSAFSFNDIPRVKKYKGWYQTIIETDQYIRDNYSDGRDLWYVLKGAVYKYADDNEEREERDTPILIRIRKPETFFEEAVANGIKPRVHSHTETDYKTRKNYVSWCFYFSIESIYKPTKIDGIPVFGTGAEQNRVTIFIPTFFVSDDMLEV